MQYFLRIKLLSFLLAINLICFSQQQIIPVFTIYSVPPNIEPAKLKLNDDIKSATTKDEVKKILKAKIANFKTGRILVIYNRNQWFTIYPDMKQEVTKDIIVTQTKGIEKINIDYKSDFRKLFKDTLVILDTLSLKVFLQDEDNYINTNYYFNYICGNSKKEIRSFIPVKDDKKLLICHDIFNSCKTNRISIKLYNKADEYQILGDCLLVFLTKEEKEELKQVAQQFLNEGNMDVQKAAENVCSFINTYYGTVQQNAVTELLNNILITKQ